MNTGYMNILGLGSGMDLQGTIDKLISVDKKPIINQQTKKVQLESFKKDYDTLESKCMILSSDITKARGDMNYQKASISDESIADVSISGVPSSGNHSLSVSQLATSQSWISTSGFSSTTDIIGSGTFSFKIGDKSYSINVDSDLTSSTPSTLQEFVNALNNSSSGLHASLIYDGSNYKVVLKTPEGTDSDLTITQNDTNITFNSTPDIPSQDAELTIDGVQVVSHTNELDNYIQGVKIDLKATGSSTISINTDFDQISTDMGNIVKDYNDIIDYISANSGYDNEKNIADAFFGSATTQSLQSSMRNIFLNEFNSAGEIRYAADIGLSFDANGKLLFDQNAFATALKDNFQDVSHFLNETDTGKDDGFLPAIKNILDNSTSYQGSIELKKTSLQNQIDSISDQINVMNKNLETEKNMLIYTFGQMDQYIGTLKSQSDYMTQIFDSMNNNKK